MMHFSIYYFKDHYGILNNVYKWLEPNGYFIVHMVNRMMFDPVVAPANPVMMVNPQKYAKQRITTSVVKFNAFEYKSTFKLDEVNDRALFEEVFVSDDNNHIRKHIHKLNMPKQKDLLDIASNIGFKIVDKLDLVNIEYEYNFLYILQKPE